MGTYGTFASAGAALEAGERETFGGTLGEARGLWVTAQHQTEEAGDPLLWLLVKVDPAPLGTPHTFAAVIVARRMDDGWGYKPMDESFGPIFVSIPLDWLDQLDTPRGYSAAWRERVRKAAAA